MIAYNFEHWLLTNLDKCSNNHAQKHIQLIKQVLKHAVRKHYIKQSPLQYYELNFDKPSLPVFLTSQELSLLKNYKFTSPSLQKVADLFLFQCCVGFAYTDLVSFHPDDHVRKGMDDQDWIYKERDKSEEMAVIPFGAKPFDQARKILAKYNGNLPKITNQSYNRFLKEIMAILNIKKNLTTHVARKTAAMQWLNAGVPEETVARILGHNSTKQLKVYAQVQEKKIAKDVEFLD